MLHTDIRWLSVRKYLQGFFVLRKEIHTNAENLIGDAQFLADLKSYLNELNLKLQEKHQNTAHLFLNING